MLTRLTRISLSWFRMDPTEDGRPDAELAAAMLFRGLIKEEATSFKAVSNLASEVVK